MTENAADLLAEGKEAFQAENYKLATRRFRQAKEENFWISSDLPRMLGVSLARRGRIREAEDTRKDLSNDPERLMDVDLAIGVAHIDRKEWEKAKIKLENLANDYPGEWNVWLASGNLALKTNDFESAKAHYQKARIFGGDDTGIGLGLAQCHERLGEYGAAIEEYLGTLEEDLERESIVALKRVADKSSDEDAIKEISKRIRKIESPRLWLAWAQQVSLSHPAISRRIFRALVKSIATAESLAEWEEYWSEFAFLAAQCNLIDLAADVLFAAQSSLGVGTLSWYLQDSIAARNLLLRAARCPWFNPSQSGFNMTVPDAITDDVLSEVIRIVSESRVPGLAEAWADHLVSHSYTEKATDLFASFSDPEDLTVDALASRARVSLELGDYDGAFEIANLYFQKLPDQYDSTTVFSLYERLLEVPRLAATDKEYIDRLTQIIHDRGIQNEIIIFSRLLSLIGRTDDAFELLEGVVANDIEITEAIDLLEYLIVENKENARKLSKSRYEVWNGILEHKGSTSWKLSTARILGTLAPEKAKEIVDNVVEHLDEASELWPHVAGTYENAGVPEKAYACFRKAHYHPLGGNDYFSWYRVARQVDIRSGARAILGSAFSDWNLEGQIIIDWDEIRKADNELQSRVSEIIRYAAEDLDWRWEFERLVLELWENNRWGEVECLLNQIIELEPNEALHLQRLTVALVELSRPKEAKAAADAADKLDPSTAYGSWRAASALLELDDIQGAIERLEIAKQSTNSTRDEKITTLDLLSSARTMAGDLYDARLNAELGLSLATEELKVHPEKANRESLSMWPRFRLAYVLNEMGAQDEAIDHYQALETSRHPFPVHNIASIFESRACFSEARLFWKKALELYLESFKSSMEKRDAVFMFNFAVALRVYGRPNLATEICRIGLLFSPNNSLGLLCLLEACIRVADTTEDLEAASRARRMASNAYSQLRNCCGDSSPGGSTYDRLYRLGVGALSMDDLTMAIEKLKMAVSRRNFEDPARKSLISALLKANQPGQAVSQGKALVAIKPDDLETMILLGRAYLEKRDLTNAERYYRRVLQFAHRHYDAKMGIGELYLALAEKNPSSSEKQTLVDLYQRAAKAFVEAYDIAISEDRAKNYTNSELAEVRYLQGYALIGQYEATPIKSGVAGLGILKEAQKAFQEAHALNEDHHKAERAARRIREKTNWLSSEAITQRWGPVFVCILSLMILGLVTYNYVWGQKEHQPARYELTKIAMDLLGDMTKSLKEPQLSSFKLLQGKVFSSSDDFLNAVEKITGPEWAKKHALELTVVALVPSSPGTRKFLEVGYFIMAAFGTLLFFIAGLYLPQLTNLKIGNIQLEKSSAQQSFSGNLGITRESFST